MVDSGTFPNMKIGNRRLNRLSKKRSSKIRKLSNIAFIDGRWQCVYFAGPPFGGNMVQHHTEVSLILQKIELDEYCRWDVPCDADVLLVINDVSYLLENHRGTQNEKDMEKRIEKLKEWDGTILWVCKNETVLKEVMRHTKPISEKCLYTTFAQATTDPHADDAWRFTDGLRTDLPRVGEQLDP